MKTGSLGPKRQLHDKTYFLVELKNRCAELVKEVEKLTKEINDIQQENVLYVNLEKRYEGLVKSVRSLEGDLADHNLATDKRRTDTQPEEVHHMYLIMKSQNDQQRNDVDQLFLEKRSHEEEIGRMIAECEAITRSAESRLNELHPDQRREYQELQVEGAEIGAELTESREQLDVVKGRLNTLEAALRGDPLRTHHQNLSAARKEIEDELERLRLEVHQGSRSVPEQREILLAKVKSDNAEIVATEKSNGDLKLGIERLKAQMREIQNDSNEQKEENGDRQKYEILFTKDQEMTEFIDNFGDSKADEEKKLKEKQDQIQQHLTNISRTLQLPTDVSPESHLRDMEDDLDFKNKQLQNSETTQNRLEGELSKRAAELEKIQNLDDKISQELAQVEEKQEKYQDELASKYEKVDDMRAQGAMLVTKMETSRKLLQDRAAATRQQVNFLKLRLESKAQQLKDNEAAEKLDSQEQKISQFGQTLHTLMSFIRGKNSESDFSEEVNNCFDIANSLNSMLHY